MKFLDVFKTIIGIASVLFAISVVQCFVTTSADDNMIICLKKFFMIKDGDGDGDGDDGVPDDMKDTPEQNKKCKFIAKDIYTNMVYKNDGTLVTTQPNMTCADCTKYIYKDREGKCYKFVHDPNYNAYNYCLQEQQEEMARNDPFVTKCNDMCTAQFTATQCPF